MPAPDPDAQTSWQPTLATVTSCRRTYATWFVDESSPDEGGTYHLAQWLVSFSYSVNGETYRGRFQAGSPHRPGDTFDPAHPQNHTGSDPKRSPATRLLLLAIAVALIALLMHFFPDVEW